MAKRDTSKKDPEFDSLTVPEKIVKGRELIEFLTANPNCSRPDLPLDKLKATIDELERIYNEAQLAERITAVTERKAREAQERFLKLVNESPITWH